VHYPYVPPDRYRGLFYEGNPCDPGNRALDRWWSHPLGAMARDTWLRTSDGLVTDPRYVTALYDREIRHLDDGVGALVGALEEMGLRDNTLVMLLADHGESMTEHGIFYDHYGLYDCTLRVPLLAQWPGVIQPGVRLPEMLQLLDVAPTLLDACGLPVPEAMDGRSFFPRLSGAGAPSVGYDRIFSVESTWQAKWSLRTEREKLIVSRQPDLLGNPPRELYDLTADPDEERNLAEREPERARHLEASLEAWIAERLEALGRNEDPVRTEGPSMLATWERHRG
jgi:arylsulfatase A-like enzyme